VKVPHTKCNYLASLNKLLIKLSNSKLIKCLSSNDLTHYQREIIISLSPKLCYHNAKVLPCFVPLAFNLLLNYTKSSRVGERQSSCCLMDARCIMHQDSTGDWLLCWPSSRRFSGWRPTSHCSRGWNGKSFRQKQKATCVLEVGSFGCGWWVGGCSTFAGAAHITFMNLLHTQLSIHSRSFLII
jgi:hypothetical protein